METMQYPSYSDLRERAKSIQNDIDLLTAMKVLFKKTSYGGREINTIHRELNLKIADANAELKRVNWKLGD